MKKIITFILTAILTSPALSASELKTPESAQIYRGKIYVSNIGNTPPHVHDGDGYISVLDLNGKVILPKLATGLDAPKGIAFFKENLFVTDIDRVVVFNIKTGKKIKVIKIKGAKFLNDIAYDGKGHMFVSDTQTDTIYKINVKNYTATVYMQNRNFGGANGLAFDRNNNLIVAGWGNGKITKILADKTITMVKGLINPDGVCVSGANIYISDFSAGKLYMFDGKRLKVVASGLKTPADIGCNDEMIVVPEFHGNDVKIIRMKQ